MSSVLFVTAEPNRPDWKVWAEKLGKQGYIFDARSGDLISFLKTISPETEIIFSDVYPTDKSKYFKLSLLNGTPITLVLNPRSPPSPLFPPSNIHQLLLKTKAIHGPLSYSVLVNDEQTIIILGEEMSRSQGF